MFIVFSVRFVVFSVRFVVLSDLLCFQSGLLYFLSGLMYFQSDLLYCQSELFTFEMKSDYYDLVFMGRFKKYCTCNLCLIIVTSKRHLRSLGRPLEMFMRSKARSHLQSIFFRRF
jgi:hypothetical protein